MTRFSAIWAICVLLYGSAISQKVKLSAEFDGTKRLVKLNWNMVNSSSKTTFILLRSTDGITWTEAAKDRILRNYTDADVYSFDDKYYSPGKNYYRLKISDENNNTIALSTIIEVNTNAITNRNQSTSDWIIYPNPASDLLTLNYKGNGNIQGVVKVQITDVTGKIVLKFRSASINKIIQIPISNLKRGMYVIQVSVLNESVMNQQFLKN